MSEQPSSSSSSSSSSFDARRVHWDDRYATIGATEVSWHEDEPAMSLQALDAVGASPSSSIIDVGGGSSHLVDSLLDRGFDDLTVLDVSQTALDDARRRVGDRPHLRRARTRVLLWASSGPL